jgi:CHAT domain-containing protein
MLGESEEAVVDCGESADAMSALGDNYGEAVAHTGCGWAYIYLGDVSRAFADFDASLNIRRRIGDRQGETLDLLGIGWTHVLRREYGESLDHFQQSLRVLDDMGDPRGRQVRLGAIGEVYRRTGRPSQAIEYLTQALRLSRASGNDLGGEAETLTGIGWCRYALGQFDQAQEAFAEALPIRRAVGDRTGEAATTLGRAHVERARGDFDKARHDIEAALSTVESLRAHVTSQSLRLSFFALAQDYYEFYIDLLMQMHRLKPDGGFAAAALEVSERARARSLLDLLNETGVDVRQGVPADLLEREQTLHLRLNSAAGYQRQLLSETYTASQAAAAASEVEDLSAALGEVEARIRHASPRYAALTRPQPLTAAEIESEVGDDTLLLEYALGPERSFLWVVSPSGVTAYELSARREIEQAAKLMRELLTARNRAVAGDTPEQHRARVEAADAQYGAAAARLSDLLIAPAVAQLKSKRLVIVAPGVLQLTAFAALPTPQPQTGATQPLIVGHELVTLPSASTLALRRREPQRREPPKKLIAILADPVFSRADERFSEAAPHAPVTGTALMSSRVTAAGGLSGNDNAASAGYEKPPYATMPRLFRTRWEAEQIAALAPPGAALLLLDFDATPGAVSGEAVSGSRIIHLATHAVIDDARPQLSGLILSMFDREGHPLDGLLRAHEISGLRLSADLIVLSACRAAAGRDFRGEGLVSLTRAFMLAGIPRVVGSLWEADDKATAELMVRFYRRLLKDSMRPAAALRAAQLEMWRDKRWRPAYFWSGFLLQGEWR